MNADGDADDENELARSIVCILTNTQNAIASVHDRPVSDTAVAEIALMSTIHKNADIIELKLTKSMAVSVLGKIDKIKPSLDEVVLLLFCASRRNPTPTASRLFENSAVVEHVKRVEGALQNTLKEAVPSSAWASQTTKLACVLAFHVTSSPLDALNSIFGSIVRSDIRRSEDLHDSNSEVPLDSLELCRVVEALASVLVL